MKSACALRYDSDAALLNDACTMPAAAARCWASKGYRNCRKVARGYHGLSKVAQGHLRPLKVSYPRLPKAISSYCSECVVVAMHVVNLFRKTLAINSRSRLRWSCDRDPVECTLHFYFALGPAAASAAFSVVLHARRRGMRPTSKSFKDRSSMIEQN